MAELCRKCFIETWHPNAYDIEHIVMNIDIEPDEAFRILCKTLNMEFVLNEDIDFFVAEDKYGNVNVYTYSASTGDIYDDRGDLFVALRNVAVTIFPNLSFRNAEYIFYK